MLAMNLASIQYALEVSRQGSFNKAAQALGVDQSAVSRRVRAFEDSIGVSLFEREGNRIRETAAGRRFLHDARRILDHLDKAAQSARLAGEGVEGELCIGVQISLTDDFLVDLFREFRRKYPTIILRFFDIFDETVSPLINDRQIDFLLRSRPTEEHDLQQQMLWDRHAHVIMPAGHGLQKKQKIYWQDIKDEHFLARNNTASEIFVCENFRKRGWEPSIESHLLKRDDLFELTGMGMGIMVATIDHSMSSGDKLVMRPMARRSDRINFYGLWSDRNDNPAFRRFLSLARKRAAISH